MLRRFGVGNFKAFDDVASLELRPITLLFGPNSAGKSSWLHSVIALHDILQRGNVDVVIPGAGGTAVDLGGIQQYAHRGNSAVPIRWSLVLDRPDPHIAFPRPLFDLPLRFCYMAYEYEGQLVLEADISDGHGTLVHVSRKGTGTGSSYCRISEEHPAFVDGVSRLVSSFRFREHLLESHLDAAAVSAVLASVLQRGVGLTASTMSSTGFLVDRDFMATTLIGEDDPFELMFLTSHHVGELLGRASRAIIETIGYEHTLHEIATAILDPEARPEIEAWPAAQQSWEESGMAEEFGTLDSMQTAFEFAYRIADELWVDALLKRTFGAIQELFSRPIRALDSLAYLGPLRAVPTRGFIADNRVNLDSGIGEDEWLTLARSPEAREAVNHWLGEGGLGTSLRLVARHHFSVNEPGESPLRTDMSRGDAARPMVSPQSPAARDNGWSPGLFDLNAETYLGMRDVGFGVSQVLPVLARAIGSRDRLHLLEQPEIHLHPALQARLADAFIEGANRYGNRFILETHSEHLLLRLLRRIRETSRDGNPAGLALRPNDIAVYFFARDDLGRSRISPIAVSDDGDFLDPWPSGFFPERLEELGP